MSVAPTPLLRRLDGVDGMQPGCRRLVLVWPQLGDFDSMEYAQALVPQLPRLEAAGVSLLAIAIGNQAGRQRFCTYTSFPANNLLADANANLHQSLGLYAGLQQFGTALPNLLLMCAGFGSPGTLSEVLRGYSGDAKASSRLTRGLWARLPGKDQLRPFELATIRLANMVEVLGHWRTYVPSNDYLTQRGGTFLLDADDSLLYVHRDPGLLGFSATMAKPLQFIEPWLPSLS